MQLPKIFLQQQTLCLKIRKRNTKHVAFNIVTEQNISFQISSCLNGHHVHTSFAPELLPSKTLPTFFWGVTLFVSNILVHAISIKPLLKNHINLQCLDKPFLMSLSYWLCIRTFACTYVLTFKSYVVFGFKNELFQSNLLHTDCFSI